MRKSQKPQAENSPDLVSETEPSTMPKETKPKSKTKNLFMKLFSRKMNYTKTSSKCPHGNSITKAIAQSTITIFSDALCPGEEEQEREEEEKLKESRTKISSSISAGNMIDHTDSCSKQWISESTLLYSDICQIETQVAPMASVESLLTNVSSQRSSGRIMRVPQIFEVPPPPPSSSEEEKTNTTSLDYCNCEGESADLLTIPVVDRSRKSSDNDSAVDMKFTDDISDQGDRTTYSETDSSRCTSSSLVIIDDCKVEKTSSLKVEPKSAEVKRTDSASSWRKIKVALVWTPFIQQYARHRYPWIQIAGHQGNFKPGEQGTILKKHTGRESICLQMMCEDILFDFVPTFKGDVEFEGERYICMEDLLAQFTMPSLMDIKMGTRTYLEEELLKAKSSPKPRQDMYEKMIEIDKNEPTEEEHKLRAVLKPRYMQWRETLSSTLTLGFRIEGVKNAGNRNNKNIGTQSRNFKRTRYRHEVKETLLDFIDNNPELPRIFIQRIEDLKTSLRKSSFFWDHEFIGSSLLFVHDKTGKANIWMIDFGKTVPLPPKLRIDHISLWNEGNHEDGYLFGLENLLILFEEIHSELSNDSN